MFSSQSTLTFCLSSAFVEVDRLQTGALSADTIESSGMCIQVKWVWIFFNLFLLFFLSIFECTSLAGGVMLPWKSYDLLSPECHIEYPAYH